ncbi:pilus assembly protein [Vibrio fluvialis]|uniref:TadE/TadG family type IV pilus assembly protein n=1 Tax=Vibrio fluvialis TaxID=676 RepID=UPI001C9C1B31|nr:TadE family protein [Vibrio fluvialis]EKO3434516.1 pilus assembly protein [Vibrio fluvialis]EKO3468081.1 pilus assembly protein [Vibrio fluvialis]MBY7801396.1 pilus assembly protein [Vibrio fluvialis]MBY7930609.1 pilus assembly protein [Vibrio fluvialis]MBY7998105.1 pilus assembly protein [Vibrio fluvialis]
MNQRRRKQDGLTVVEFSLVASVFLLILFAVIEVGIFVFQLQSLNDISRRAARIAAVCVVNDPDIKTLALSENTPIGFTGENIEIVYLKDDGSVVGDPIAQHSAIHYVRSKIINYNYGFSGILNFLGNNGLVPVPDFQTILPAESLGVLKVNDPNAKTDC